MALGLFKALLAELSSATQQIPISYVLDAMDESSLIKVDGTPVDNNAVYQLLRWFNTGTANRTRFANLDTTNWNYKPTVSRYPGTAVRPPYVKVSQPGTQRFFATDGDLNTRYLNPVVATEILLPGPKTLMNTFFYHVFNFEGPTMYTQNNNTFLILYDHPKNAATGTLKYYSFQFRLNVNKQFECSVAGGGTGGGGVKVISSTIVADFNNIYIIGMQWNQPKELEAPASDGLVFFIRTPDNVLTITKTNAPIGTANTTSLNYLWILIGSYFGNMNQSVYEFGCIEGIKSDAEIDSFTLDLHNKWRVPNSSWQT